MPKSHCFPSGFQPLLVFHGGSGRKCNHPWPLYGQPLSTPQLFQQECSFSIMSLPRKESDASMSTVPCQSSPSLKSSLPHVANHGKKRKEGLESPNVYDKVLKQCYLQLHWSCRILTILESKSLFYTTILRFGRTWIYL
jgi:hypothetical protein